MSKVYKKWREINDEFRALNIPATSCILLISCLVLRRRHRIHRKAAVIS